MRALLLTIFLSLVSVNVAQGQALLVLLFGDKLSTEKFQLGINADIGWTGQTNLLDSSTRFSWAFGAYGEVKLGERWRLQPELTLKTPAGAEGLFAEEAGNPFAPTGNEDIDEVIDTGRVTRSLTTSPFPSSPSTCSGRWASGVAATWRSSRGPPTSSAATWTREGCVSKRAPRTTSTRWTPA